MNRKYNQFLQSASREDLISILENLPEIYFRTDLNGTFLWVSPSVKPVLGYDPDDLIGKNLADILVHGRTGGASAWMRVKSDQTGTKNREFRSRLKESSGKLFDFKIPLKHKFGAKLWVSANIQYIYKNNIPEGIEGTAAVLTSTSETQKELFIEKERAHITLNSISDGVITTDAIGNIEYMNPSAEELCGWTSAEAKGLQLNSIFKLSHPNGTEFECSLQNCCSKYTREIPKYLELTRKDGEHFSVEHSTSPIVNDSSTLSGIVVVFRNVTRLKKMEEKLLWQASHDTLTGLINRMEFENRMLSILLDAGKTGFCLCYIDLDNFKTVNDTCGHIAGDDLLKRISAAMERSLNESCTLARVGGDEFAIIIQAPAHIAYGYAETVLNSIINFNFFWENRKYAIGASIGITEIYKKDTDIKTVINRSDKACYTAKESGGNRICFYTNDIKKKFIDTEWVEKIKHALQEDTFIFLKQNGISLNNSLLVYSEIFIKLRDECSRIISPMEFLPAAKKYRLTSEIDRHVIKKIFSMPQEENEIIGINLCGQSLFDPAMHYFIISLAEKFNIDPRKISFEINELTAIEDITSTIRFIELMKPHGFLFALDDVGKTDQFIGYLKSVPVDFFKIGNSIMKNIQTDPVDFQLVETIHQIAQILGKRTIAEFIENEETLKKITGIGIQLVQGFHINSPVILN